MLSKRKSLKKNSRATAAHIIAKTLRNKLPLDIQLSDVKEDKAFVQYLCYGVCRYYFRLSCLIKPLLAKPLKPKDTDLFCLLLLGAFQLTVSDTEPFAAIHETVEAAKQLGKSWAANLINAILRRVERMDKATIDTLLHETDCPDWLIAQIANTWPQQTTAISTATNQPAPLTLRVNQGKQSRLSFIAKCESANIACTAGTISPDAVIMESAVDVKQLPDFSSGSCSVQDEAAQLAVDLLDCQPNDRVLDACAAPGGKSCHILERQPSVTLTALDVDAIRQQRTAENCQRLNICANIVTGDLAYPEPWWDGTLFDRILLDAPCSALGVIRRHPDIKLLREHSMLARNSNKQVALLTRAWTLLQPSGTLLYATCSFLPVENDDVIARFLADNPSASVQPINADWGIAGKYGRYLLPGITDGFYYCTLKKT